MLENCGFLLEKPQQLRYNLQYLFKKEMERVLDWTPQPPYTAEQLLQVIRILRDPENGCPWDKVQTHASIRKNFLEETCEALEAIDADDPVLLREELGDVLMQVVFHAAMEEAEEAAPEQPARKTCPQCGAPVSDDALFCNKCGAQL